MFKQTMFSATYHKISVKLGKKLPLTAALVGDSVVLSLEKQ